jgi:16S rRNA (cytidine1402-2'-O)-methyltransferase
VTAALSIGGLPTDRFLFLGFLPPKTAGRRAALADVKDIAATLVFLEAPSRLAASLSDLAAVLGARPAAIAREMTKIHEEVRRGTLRALAQAYGAEDAPKGEIVILVGPPEESAMAPSDDVIEAALTQALAQGQSLKLAVAAVAGAQGLPRRIVYARALALKAGR